MLILAVLTCPRYVGDDYSQPRNGGVKVSIADLPMLSRRSFPLCMANQHAKLGETHHLKNDARNQFGLFLKGIGLTYEESYAYWRAEFGKNMTGEKFDKEYRYGIRCAPAHRPPRPRTRDTRAARAHAPSE